MGISIKRFLALRNDLYRAFTSCMVSPIYTSIERSFIADSKRPSVSQSLPGAAAISHHPYFADSRKKAPSLHGRKV